MARRFYFNRHDNAPSAGANSSAWEQTSGAAAARVLNVSTGSSSIGAWTNAETSATQPWDVLIGAWCTSVQFEAYSFSASDTWKLQMQCIESNVAADYYLAFVVSAWDSTYTTKRGDIVAFIADGTEMDKIAYENRSMSGTCASVSMLEGDKIQVEAGFRSTNTKTTSYDGGFYVGNDQASDLPEDDSTTGTSYNPWFELSPTLPLYGVSVWTPKVIIF